MSEIRTLNTTVDTLTLIITSDRRRDDRILTLRVTGFNAADAFVGLQSNHTAEAWDPEEGNVGTDLTLAELRQIRDWLVGLDLDRPLPEERGLYQALHGGPMEHAITFRHSGSSWLNALSNEEAGEEALRVHNGPNGPLARLIRQTP